MIVVHTHSEPGGHPNIEDAHWIRAHPTAKDVWLCCVADGKGGQAGGAQASRVACQSVMGSVCRTPAWMLAWGFVWTHILRRADRSVTVDSEAGQTTLVAFCIRRGRIIGASNGDSAVLLLNHEGATILTNRQVKIPPVGSGSAVFTGFNAKLGKRWQVLAMTDGVWKCVGWDRVIDTARSYSGNAVLVELRDLARLPGSERLQDDFTAILIGPDAEQRT